MEVNAGTLPCQTRKNRRTEVKTLRRSSASCASSRPRSLVAELGPKVFGPKMKDPSRPNEWIGEKRKTTVSSSTRFKLREVPPKMVYSLSQVEWQNRKVLAFTTRLKSKISGRYHQNDSQKCQVQKLQEGVGIKREPIETIGLSILGYLG